MRALLCCLLPTLFVSTAAAEPWVKVDHDKTGVRDGSMLVAAPDLKQMLLVGVAKDKPFAQAFDPATNTWSDFAGAGPVKNGIDPYYQTTYDPGTKTIYCLSGGSTLYAFNTADKTWKTHPPAAELDGLSWHALACDPVGKRLVVVGSDKKLDNLGWLRTVVYDIPTGTWQRLDVADAKVVAEHKQLVAVQEELSDLVGRIRLAWYRDPKGVGSDAELADLARRCETLKKNPALAKVGSGLDDVANTLAKKQTLDALKTARAVQRTLEELTEAQYPVPCSRRNSPLVFDAKNNVFVLFGGDHENYLMNDTWVLDLNKKSWRRAAPGISPSPRAGHALVHLPASGRIALYEGYDQSNNTDYSAGPSRPIEPAQLWLYDVAADRWDLAGSWPRPKKGDAANPPPVGRFYGYASDRFSPPALSADANDRLILASNAGTWTFRVEPTKLDAAKTLGAPANSRLARNGPFRAEYCEVADAPKDTGLESLPENQWVKLPPSPRNPCKGCRGRDWGTSVWDSDRDQILLWGGGHCVRSASTVTHYSPTSGRTVEGFDADEPYGANGGGGFDSSVLNRPWVSVHNYRHYAYDPKCKLLVAGRGYLYDPERMDWLRMEQLALPYRFAWGSTVVSTSPHGAVAWAHKKSGDDAGLWLFDRDKGWIDLQPKGKLFPPYCDSHGMVYDAKRDRMLMSSVGGGYSKRSNGSLLAFDFKTRELTTLTPENPELTITGCARELAYIDHADWLLIGDNVRTGDPKTGKSYTRIYDCAKNRTFLLDAGPVPDGYAAGWMYDAKRKLVYAFTTGGEAWALRLAPASVRRIENVEK